MFFIEKSGFYIWELSRDDSGIVQDIFKSYFLSVGHAAGAFFPPKYAFLDFWDMLNLEKLHFCPYLVFLHFCPLKNEQKNKKLLGAHQVYDRPPKGDRSEGLYAKILIVILVSPEKCFVFLLVLGGPKSAEIPNMGKSSISPNSACPTNPEMHIF